MRRRQPRSTQGRSSAASDVYKRQAAGSTPPPGGGCASARAAHRKAGDEAVWKQLARRGADDAVLDLETPGRVGELMEGRDPVSYTHLRAHETVLDIVCRLLLEKKKNKIIRLRLAHSTNATNNTYNTIILDTSS